MLRKGLIIGITLLLVCASLVIVPAETEAAKNLENLGTGPVGIIPKDMAWKPDGSVALVVGFDSNLDGRNAALYYPDTDSWVILTSFPASFTSYTLNKVAWAEGMFGGSWVCVGDGRGAGTNSAYYVMDGTTSMNELLTSGNYPNNVVLRGVASDVHGNVMVVAPGGVDYIRFYSNFYGAWYTISNMDDTGYWYDVDYDTNNYRFYFVGKEISGPFMINYADQNIASSDTPTTIYQYDVSVSDGYYTDIYWNNDPDLAPSGNFAILFGSDNHIYTMTPVEVAFFVEACSDCPTMTYIDMAWDTDWQGATFIGSNGNALIYRYSVASDAFVKIFDSPGVTGYCVGYKPPSSPGWPIVLGSGGPVKILATEFDITTKITANAVFPKLYSIDFIDTGLVSRLEQQVPVNDWYNFTCVANYSQDWNNVRVEVRAWHDGGAVPGAYPAESADNRDQAFRLYYWPSNSTYMVMYPVAPANMEIDIGALGVTDTPLFVNPGIEDHHQLTMPIYLGSQIRWGNGQGWITGDPATSNQGTGALLDPDSWNFNITIRDDTNTNAYNVSYAEFGIDETISVSVTGNPSGNAPPGSSSVLLANPSQITYSANTGHWVNVSIPDLLENGVGPASIAATNVEVQNADPYADAGNSQISGATSITGAGTDMQVWGLGGVNIAAPSNGTVACGPWVTDYNAGGLGLNAYTVLDWWVTVPGGTNEGIYWAVITVTIDS